jgi:hypothetical protein
MIIAHRLLKNEIPQDEYVIVTNSYLQQLNEGLGCDLNWSASDLAYEDVGDIGIQYALLEDIKGSLPDPPDRDRPVIPHGDDAVELEIGAPLLKVYSMLIDVDRKREWVVGLDDLTNEASTARVGQRHTCFFQGMGIDFELVKGEFTGSEAIYSETAAFHDLPFQHHQTYTLRSAGEGTSVRFEVKWGSNPSPPDEMKQQFVGGCAASFEVLRGILEEPS